MTDVVLGAIIGAGAAVVGGVVAGAFDLVARKQDQEHDASERATDREVATSARREERQADQRAAWRETAVMTLGQALEFATDLHPSPARLSSKTPSRLKRSSINSTPTGRRFASP
jgi:hypothetical protein